MNYFAKIIRIGLKPDLKLEDSYKVKLSNIFIILASPIYFAYLIFGYIYNSPISFIIGVTLTLSAIIAFYFNYKFQYQTARILMFTVVPIIILISHNIFNVDNSMLCYFFPLFFAYSTFYDFKADWKIVLPSFLFSIICLIAAFILPKFYFYQIELSKDAIYVSNNYLQYILPFLISIFFIGASARLNTNLQNKLIESKEDAIRANNAKSQFLSNMSHELRTPLNGIIGATNLIKIETEDALKEEYYEVLEYSGQHMLKLINEILDYSKVEAGEIRFDKTTFNLSKTLKNIAQTFSNQPLTAGVNFFQLIDKNIDFFVESDELRLTQILSNLLSNAFKFTHKGSVTFEANLIQQTNQTAIISFVITDTGIGIKEENLEMIFKSFTQAESGTTRKYGGTGLGLTISKELVKLFDSKLMVTSKYNQGSTFSFQVTFSKALPNLDHFNHINP